MRHLLTLLAALLLCSAPLHAQTLKSLMYNSTNGQVVANTGTNVLTFTNTVQITTLTNVGGGIFTGDMNYANNGISGYDGNEINFEEGTIFGHWTIYGSLSFDNTTNAATTRANLGFSTNLNTLWTATNVTNFRSAIGLGATNNVTFNSLDVADYVLAESIRERNDQSYITFDNDLLRLYSDNVIFIESPLQFETPTLAATTRANLGLGASNTVTLAGLTNNGDLTINGTTATNG